MCCAPELKGPNGLGRPAYMCMYVQENDGLFWCIQYSKELQLETRPAPATAHQHHSRHFCYLHTICFSSYVAGLAVGLTRSRMQVARVSIAMPTTHNRLLLSSSVAGLGSRGRSRASRMQKLHATDVASLGVRRHAA